MLEGKEDRACICGVVVLVAGGCIQAWIELDVYLYRGKQRTQVKEEEEEEDGEREVDDGQRQEDDLGQEFLLV